MPYEPVLGIDVGASYSKISFRTEIPKPDARTFCTTFVGQISSLCVRDLSRGKEAWFFDEEAANMTLGPKAHRSENWKAELFSEASGSKYADAVIVAHKFFEWLHRWLGKKGIDPNRQRVRVCVPALDNVEPYASTIAQIMESSGWNDVEILKISEPRANAVGIMSGGRNCLLANGVPGYGPMYGPGGDYAEWVRRELHGQRSHLVRVVIIDVGSFTTDLAGIIIDLHTAESDGIRTELQKSWEFGIINELDKLALRQLLSSHGLQPMALKFTEQEELKRHVYSDQEFAVLGAILGESADDKQIIKQGLRAFCKGICDRIEDYIEKFNPDYAYLTGGGSSIAKVREALSDFLKKHQCFVIPIPFVDVHCTDRPAERVATTLGAASMILDAQEPGVPAEVSFESRPPTDPSFVKCRCRGGNKDCCFCWGRGYYRRAINV
jgi:hypothetical protein